MRWFRRNESAEKAADNNESSSIVVSAHEKPLLKAQRKIPSIKESDTAGGGGNRVK